MTGRSPDPNPTPAQPGPPHAAAASPAPAGPPSPEVGIDLSQLLQLLQALGKYAPAILEMLQKLVQLLHPSGPTPARAGAGGPVDHLACCQAELEHLMAATAICLHHCHCCQQRP